MTAMDSHLWRRLSAHPFPRSMPSGMDAVWHATRKWKVRAGGTVARLRKRSDQIVILSHRLRDLGDSKLQLQATELGELFGLGREKPHHVDYGLALVREVSRRTRGETPYSVQLTGALAMRSGGIAEMATGEGKTLAVAMAAVINAWRRRGCHVVTANDYLARRDAEAMTPIYAYCGLTVAAVTAGMDPSQRRRAYAADVTYCTGREVAADFLRDEILLGRQRGLCQTLLRKFTAIGANRPSAVLRPLHCAIVDEADSVLIDEASTPLMIEGPVESGDRTHSIQCADALARHLVKGVHYKVDTRSGDVALTMAGRDELAAVEATWAPNKARHAEELLIQSIRAGETVRRNEQYVVDRGQVVVVDEQTGRLARHRSFRDGLHQAIEAREHLPISGIKATRARVCFQRFFRLYSRLSGVSGTVSEVASELWRVYGLATYRIPTRVSCRRHVAATRVFRTQAAKWSTMIEAVAAARRDGRPVLIGMRSVAESEQLADRLRSAGIIPAVLNAVHERREAALVAQAGQAGQVTVATNMAGRGTDIALGPGVAERGGLHVILGEHQLSRRLDRQLMGRAARQGDPGSAVAFASLEDEIPSRFSPRTTRAVRSLSRFRGEELPAGSLRWLFRNAQFEAEDRARRQRLALMEADDRLESFLESVC